MPLKCDLLPEVVFFCDGPCSLSILALSVCALISGASPSSTNTGMTPWERQAIVRKNKFLIEKIATWRLRKDRCFKILCRPINLYIGEWLVPCFLKSSLEHGGNIFLNVGRSMYPFPQPTLGEVEWCVPCQSWLSLPPSPRGLRPPHNPPGSQEGQPLPQVTPNSTALSHPLPLKK